MSLLNDDTHDSAVEQLLSKSWEDLEILENAGHLLFPGHLKRRKKDGSIESINVFLQIPREPDLRKARVTARNIAKQDGLDTKDDADLVDNLEIICTLSYAIRNTTPPYEPYDPFPESLEKRFDRKSLMAVWDMIEKISASMNPRPDSMSQHEMFAVIASIAKERSISPLAVYELDAQESLIQFMADQLVTSLASKLSPESSEHSTQEN